MKRSLAFFAIMLSVSLTMLAAGNYDRVFSEVVIRSFNNKPIVVDLDGRQVNHRPHRQVKLNKVVPGDRRITVFSGKGGYFGPRVLTDQVVRIRPNSRLHITIDRWGQLDVREQVRHYCERCSTHYYGTHHCEAGHGPRYGEQPYHPGPNGYAPGKGRHYQYGMRQVQFSQLKQTIRRTSFESTKKSIMRQGLAGQNITAQQLRQLLRLLSFENSKVEMAKWAYGKVADKENIFVIYREFTFESSIRRLEKHFAGW